jgi:hypothetical protein
MFRALIMLLDANPNYLEASRALRVSERLPFIWLKASKEAQAAGETESEYLFKFDPDDADEAPQWLHEHVRAAISISIEQIEAAARHRARDGTMVPAKWQGRDVWQLEDPALVDLLGLPDEYRRDAKGNRIREMVWLPPATDLVLGVLAAHARRYKKLAGGTTVNVNANAQSNGVLVIGKPKPAAPLPILEVVQPDEPPTLEELLGEDMADDEPELRPEAVEIVDRVLNVPYPPPREDAAPVPEPVMIKTPTPPEYAPAGGNPLIRPRVALSALERDLLTRASAIPGALNRKG